MTDRAIARFDRLRWSNGSANVSTLRRAMQQIMQRSCAVFRDAPLLLEGQARLDQVTAEMRHGLGLRDRSMTFNTELVEAIELENMMAQSIVTLQSAIARTESRGSHAREDFPARDDENWLRHSYAWLDGEGRTRIDYRPVRLQPLSSEISSIPPRERVY